jgi:hypothetical protein
VLGEEALGAELEDALSLRNELRTSLGGAFSPSDVGERLGLELEELLGEPLGDADGDSLGDALGEECSELRWARS